jgi:hypothetical protein
MNYHIGDLVRKLGGQETFITVATKEEKADHNLEDGFDYLIQREEDASHTEQVFEEDIERK